MAFPRKAAVHREAGFPLLLAQFARFPELAFQHAADLGVVEIVGRVAKWAESGDNQARR